MSKAVKIRLIFYIGLILYIINGYSEYIGRVWAGGPDNIVKAFFHTGGVFTDRNGRLLRFVPNKDGDYIYPVPLASQSKDLIEAVLIIEDRGFYQHKGYEPKAMLRALYQNLTHRKVISGASTITQQLIRITQPQPRTLYTKAFELCSAIILEKDRPKDWILEQYLNSVCLFGNVRGTAMAAHILYGKSPSMLNLAESATLAAAIQAPGRYNPFKKTGNQALLQRRNRILKEMLELDKCTKKAYEAALLEQIPTYPKKKPFNGPHFCDYIEKHFSKPVGVVKTTLDLDLQNKVVQTIQSHMPRLMKSGATQASMLILDSKTLEVLAFVGSAEYGPIGLGFNNGILAKRSGGSVLKPFLYALAFENGFYPSYIVSDTMRSFKSNRGDYLPENANRINYGPISMRNALGNSLNISTVKVLNQLGVENFYEMLVDLGILKYQEGKGEYYGLGLAIGNPEVRMLDLARAFSIFTNEGTLKSLSFLEKHHTHLRNVISPESAQMVFDILADEAARLRTFGNPSFFKTPIPTAIKTGTSTAYRDSWLVSDDGNYLCAIWVGNFKGGFTRNLSGATACGPIFRDVNKLRNNFERHRWKNVQVSSMEVCSISGQPPTILCKPIGKDLFRKKEYEELEKCNFHTKSSAMHELSPEYARWLETRRKYLDADPFVLKGFEGQRQEQEQESLRLEKAWAGNEARSTYSINKRVMEGLERAERPMGIEIVSPHHGDVFVSSAYHDTKIYLRAIPSEAVAEVVWFVNGEEFVRTGPPYEAYWEGEIGHYRIMAVAGTAAAEVIVEIF